MMRDRILNFLTNYGTLIQPEAVDYILSKKEPLDYVEGIMGNIEEQPLILTVEHLKKVEEISRMASSAAIKVEVNKVEIELPVKTEPLAPVIQFSSDEKPLDDFTGVQIAPKKPELVCPVQELPKGMKVFMDITGNSTCQGKIGDFKLYFNDRLKTLRKFLKGRREMAGAIPINKVKMAVGTFKVIGMVSDIRMTKKGNKMVTIEDENASLNLLLTKESELVNDPTVLDEVIGAICTKFRDDGPRRNTNLVLAQELARPDVPVNRSLSHQEKSAYLAFVSDIHVGSNTFLSEQFCNFLNWLNGKDSRKKNVAEKVEYVIIPGDTVDGIGIYPAQEEELAIHDIYGQYEELARLLKQVPEHVKVIMLPGNHDAVRPAEPQPTFPGEVRELFPPNVIFVGNPCYFSVCGVEILAYHGRSMDDFIKALPSLDYSKAIKIMKEM
jgi:DNA polymerase II small subunit